MLIFVRNEKGRPEAQEGGHDDLVMGLAITYYIREQQSFSLIESDKPRPRESSFETSFRVKEPTGDFGSKIEIV